MIVLVLQPAQNQAVFYIKNVDMAVSSSKMGRHFENKVFLKFEVMKKKSITEKSS